jgi:hypothetical protein
MRHTLLLLLLLALPVPAQDEARVKQLIQELDDDSFEVRDKAEKALVALGAEAVPQLKVVIAETERQKEKAEVRTRALSALRTIEFNAKSKLFYVEPKLVTLRATEAEIGAVLADVEKQTGVKIETGGIDAKAKVTIDVQNAPLFKVLDDLCRGQDERSYEYRDEGVRFQRSKFVPYPAAYEGPFRVRILKLKHERSTDFKASQGQTEVVLDADWQKYLKPSKKVGLELKSAKDDKGAELEVIKGQTDDDNNGGMVVVNNNRFIMRRNGVVVAAGGGGGEESSSETFTLKGMTAGVSRITLQGTARFNFPLDKSDVVFENPAAAEPQQTGDLTITVKNQAGGRLWKIAMTRTPGRPQVTPEDIDARLDKDSFVAIDDAGKEHKAGLTESRTDLQMLLRGAELPDGTPLATYQAVFPTLQGRMPKQIRFKFVTQVFVKTVPFVIKDIPLP